jgi:hypothetical protein
LRALAAVGAETLRFSLLAMFPGTLGHERQVVLTFSMSGLGSGRTAPIQAQSRRFSLLIDDPVSQCFSQVDGYWQSFVISTLSFNMISSPSIFLGPGRIHDFFSSHEKPFLRITAGIAQT